MNFKKRCIIIIFVCSSILIFAQILQATTGDGNRALKVEFNGMFRSDTDMKKWFRDISSWGVYRWVHFIPNQKRFFYREDTVSGVIKTVPFFDRALPQFIKYQDKEIKKWQEQQVEEAHNLCKEYGIEFYYWFTFPIFPYQDKKVVQKIMPELFTPDGDLNIYHPKLPTLLKMKVRTLKNSLPYLSGVEVYFGEGGGSFIEFSEKDLVDNKKWLRPLIKAFDEVCQDLGIKGIVFPHDYHHTNQTRRNIYQVLKDYPDLMITEDLTWPEENTLTPFIGYITEEDKEELMKNNPVLINCLTDTEYLGQGVLPCILPEWWKYAVKKSIEENIEIIRGRTFFWDRGYTDVNFNRMNAYMLNEFAKNPDANTREVLDLAAREQFGNNIPKRLIDIFKETEPIIKEITSVNGMNPLNHSYFPLGKFLDRIYFDNDLYMKAVSDLFQPPGTKCYYDVESFYNLKSVAKIERSESYTELSLPVPDSLDSGEQWRFQNKIHSGSVEDYIKTKNESIRWIKEVLPEVKELSEGLNTNNRDLIVTGYETLLQLAKGMKFFIKAAKVHYDWFNSGTIDTKIMQERMKIIADSLREVAEETPETRLGYKRDMRNFANFIEELPLIQK